jgi:hypothetical protein
MFSVAIDTEQALVRLARVGLTVMGAIRAVGARSAEELTGEAQQRASTEVAVHTGVYVASIHDSFGGTRSSFVAEVFADDPIVAKVVEFGATTQSHEIMPKGRVIMLPEGLAARGPTIRQIYNSFNTVTSVTRSSVRSAEAVFASVVHSPGAHIPAHHPLHKALEAKADQITDDFTKSGLDAARSV